MLKYIKVEYIKVHLKKIFRNITVFTLFLGL